MNKYKITNQSPTTGPTERRKAIYLVVIAAAMLLGTLPARAQFANSVIKGNYNFRYLGVNRGVTPNAAVSALGSISFDGQGKFTSTGQGLTHNASGSDVPTAVSMTGTYFLLTSGVVVMTNPYTATGALVYGGISVDGVLEGSTTGSSLSDLLVAIPAGLNLSNATLNGTYQFAGLEFLGGDFAGSSRNTFFPITPDGKGGLGNLAAKGTAMNLNHLPTIQTIPGATYTVAGNGSGTITFPPPALVAPANQLLSGNKTLYVSPDGNLILGGSATGYDMFIGVKAVSVSANSYPVSGLYFTGFLGTYGADSGPVLYAAQGATNEVSSAIVLAEERANQTGQVPYDYSYRTHGFVFQPDGTIGGVDFQGALGGGGGYVVESGNGDLYSLYLEMKAPVPSGSGVFLNPQGVVNAANNIPFTSRVSPGEVLALYGTGLTSQTLSASSLPFPSSLGGVSVMINGTPAPIYSTYHSTAFDLISVIVPYTIPTDGSAVVIQASNNGTPSNPVVEFTGLSQPGVFTSPAGGVGDGAILHADYTPVSRSSPATVGETVQIYLSGLGPVQPSIPAGSAAPISPLSVVPNSTDVHVFVDGVEAQVLFKGLTPTVAGLYQLNVTIPAGVTTGSDDDLEIVTRDADNAEATIPIARPVVLQVDGGTFNVSYGFPNGQAGAAFVNRLTPASYPATLQNVQIYFGNRSNGLVLETPFTLLTGTNPSGSASFGTSFTKAPAQVLSLGAFSTYSVNPVTITSGDFVVGFMVENPAGIFPADKDTVSPSQKRSYSAGGNLTFTLLDNQGLPGNLAIRATVTTPIAP